MLEYKRPLSPHLQIYKIFSKTMSSGPSIMDRMTGFILVLGFIYAVIILINGAFGPSYYNSVIQYSTFWWSKILFICFSFSFYFQVLNGIRFLLFSVGMLLEKNKVMVSGWLMLGITVICWLITTYYLLLNW